MEGNLLKKRFLVYSLTLLMLINFIQPTLISAAKNVEENSSLEEVEREVKKYISNDRNGNVIFNVDKAIKDSQSDFILEIGKKVNEINTVYKNSNNNEISLMLSLPLWGNWCGPGHGGGEAKDLLDYACMMHDKDYAKYGYFHCPSDRRLINRINTFYYQMKPAEKVAATAVKAYFQSTPYCYGVII